MAEHEHAAPLPTIGRAMGKPLTWTVLITILNGAWVAFSLFSGLATKQYVDDELSAAVNNHDHGYPEKLHPDPNTQRMPPAHHELAENVAACVNSDNKQDSALNLQRERSAALELELVNEVAARVRWQAAAAEPDWRKRFNSGAAAEKNFRQLVSDWPCLQKTGSCTTPEHAARLALETRPPY